MNHEQLVNLAKQFISDNHPEWGTNAPLSPVVEDKGTYWEVSFELPELALGGVPIVEIDKISGQVKQAYHTQ